MAPGNKVKFGITSIPFLADYGAIREIALQCENLGYHSLWSDDHPVTSMYTTLDCFTLLSALSRETKRIRLGTLVACNSYRSPVLTAKIGSTLDNISDGRFMLGYGAGWFQGEYESLGYLFPKPKTRIGQMREGVMIIERLWTEGKASFDGEFYHIKDAGCEPTPVQKPHPPIIIGGAGNRTLKTAAELGDGWNTWNAWGASIEQYQDRVGVLTEYCDGLGRRIEDLELSLTCNTALAEDKKHVKRKIEKHLGRLPREWLLAGLLGGGCTFDQCIKVLQEYVDLGCRHFIFSILTFDEEKEAFMERVASSF